LTKNKPQIVPVLSPLKLGTEESKQVSSRAKDSSDGSSYITDSNIGQLDLTESLQESIDSSLGVDQEDEYPSSMFSKQEESKHSNNNRLR
jgi:hypothetical protein